MRNYAKRNYTSAAHRARLAAAVEHIEQFARESKRDPFGQLNTQKQKIAAEFYLNGTSELSLLEVE